MKLESHEEHETKARWKIIRTDDYTDIDGEIIAADDETGAYCVSVGGENKSANLGPGAIKIVRRRR